MRIEFDSIQEFHAFQEAPLKRILKLQQELDFRKKEIQNDFKFLDLVHSKVNAKIEDWEGLPPDEQKDFLKSLANDIVEHLKLP